jgi:putative addiction module killer protein
MRIDHGPGYRVYFMQRDSVLVVVLAGGDKRTQSADIERARCIATDWERES